MSRSRRIQDHTRELFYCTFCPRLCRFACPVAEGEHRETVTPTAKMTLLHLLNEGHLPLERSVAEPWFHCTGCGLHQVVCEHGIDISPVLRLARQLAGEQGLAPEPLKKNKEFIEGREAELQQLAARLRPGAPPASESVLIPGVHALTHAPELARRAWEVLARVLPSPPAIWCGPQDLGLGLLAAGQAAALRHRAARVVQATRPFRRLWLLDPEEVWLLRAIYPEHDCTVTAEIRLPFEALDRGLPQSWRNRSRSLLAEQAEVEESSGRPPRLTYHDPCFLGRHLQVYDPPRRIIEACTGAAPVEPPWSREAGWCCGGGQHYPDLEPEGAAAVATQRGAQLATTGATHVITACPRCRTQLRQALATTGIQVLDLLELIDPRWP